MPLSGDDDDKTTAPSTTAAKNETVWLGGGDCNSDNEDRYTCQLKSHLLTHSGSLTIIYYYMMLIS
jgi:hypothetical protein